MNPIEMAFAKLKAPAPAASPNRRCSCRRIGELLDRFPPCECANFFQAAGYQRSM
jgi:hypothetical protein